MRRGDTWFFEREPRILSYASCVGVKEGEGPLSKGFDVVGEDNRFGEKTWEKSESRMVELACGKAVFKSGLSREDVGCLIGGDLLNQCISTSYAARALGFRTVGIYGACSTMAESLAIGAALFEGGLEKHPLCSASSHFCSAERQYRYPLGYGGQRAQTSQWTATACGAVIMGDGGKAKIKAATVGRVYDPGVRDAGNMGAAMAQAAYETVSAFFRDSGLSPADVDLIATGDLSAVGSEIFSELFAADGTDVSSVYGDCGLMLYDREKQDVHSGGSGCGCSAAVLCAKILPELESGALKRVLFCGTGALLSPVSVSQGESIPGICHLIFLEGSL